MSAVTGIAAAGNGQEMYAGRILAYDGLGQRLAKGVPAKDWRKVLDAANLNFRFHKDDVQDMAGNVIEGQQVVYREVVGGPNDGQRKHVGIVKMRHSLDGSQPEQMMEAAALANPGGTFETAGMLEKNCRLWVQMSGGDELVIDPKGANDRVGNYFTVTTMPNGDGATLFGDAFVRFNCTNVITSAIRGSDWLFRIRHTQSHADRVTAAVKAIAAARTHREIAAATFTELFETAFSTKQFENVVTTLHGARPEDNVKGRLTKWETMRDQHMWAWNAAHNAAIRETAWGAWQSVLEVSQWMRTMQDTPHGRENFYAAGAGFDGPTNDLRRKSLVLVGARAGVKV